MKTVADVDGNFKIRTEIQKDDIQFFDVKKEPFSIYGVFFENGKFRRMPEEVAKTVNDGVYFLHSNTAGGRVKFITDSPYVAIFAKTPYVGKMPHLALTGSVGFDLYIEDDYFKTFIPPFDITDGFESVIELGESKKREITINFPLYSDVSELYIGISKNARLSSPKPYKNQKPVVFYGSSITQGGCASRPGLSYQSIVSIKSDTDFINLGFSGSARGEETIAEYIKNLDMSVFVYDYDHNAPDLNHLEKTHGKMFDIIRQANPDLPVVMMSRPVYLLSEEEEKRLDVIKGTYNKAKENGDRNVYLIDGPELMKFAENEGTVDGCHPNDLGFMSIAKALGKVLEEILNQR